MNFTNKAIFLACSLAISGVSAAQEIVKIGLTSPLTGSQAQAGKDNESGAKMAIEQLNRSKFTVAGKAVTFQLQSEDDQGDPKAGVAVAQKLVDSKVKAVLGPYNSGVAIPASKVYNDSGIVMATVGTNPRITEQGYEHVFRLDPNDNQLGGDMAIYAAKQLKLKKIAVIDDRTAYGQGVADAFLKAAKANKIDIVSREFTNDKASEFSAILTSIKGKQVDGIFYGGYFTQAAAMKRQMKALGLDVHLLGGDAICNAETGKLGGEVVNDKLYCVQGGTVLGNKTTEKNFLGDFQKIYGKAPLTYAPYFYDGMLMIAEAMKKADSTDPAKFGPALAALKYSGVVGDYEFDSTHNLKNAPVTIYRFKDGEPVPAPLN
jgi:ABC-type branched-subunit amino acid transport system substrate-binding protein